MSVNFWPVLIASILSMPLGAIWYGPLFGNQWMKIIGADAKDKKAREEMQKSAGPLYMLQLAMTLFQVWILGFFLKLLGSQASMGNVLLIWAAFVIPTLVGASIWNNDKKEIKNARILIQGGYQLLMFVIFGLILLRWG